MDRHENGLATFSTDLYNKECAGIVCGSQNAPGINWHGIDHSVQNSVNNPATVYFSPRLGMAWDVYGTGNTVLRGGWGIYRHQEEFRPYALAAATAQGYKTTFQQASATQTLSFDQIDAQSPTNPQDFSVYTISPTDTERPIYYEFNGAVSQRLKYNQLIEIAYVGNTSKN